VVPLLRAGVTGHWGRVRPVVEATIFVKAESVATCTSYVEAPFTMDQPRVGVVEIFVPLFFGDRSFGLERERQTVIPLGSRFVLLPTMAPTKYEPVGVLFGMVTFVETGPLDAPEARFLTVLLPMKMSPVSICVSVER